MTTERLRIVAMWMVAAVLAILALLGTRSASEPAPATPPAPVRRVVPAVVVPAPAPSTIKPLAAALEALAAGRTCDDRDAAVARLRELGDPIAVPALQRALLHDAPRCSPVPTRSAIRELLARRRVAAY